MMVRGTKDKPFWKWIDGKCYAFDEEVKIYCNCVTAEGWYVDRSGACVK
jgi:N-acetylmuramoyl-L-alanine amidase